MPVKPGCERVIDATSQEEAGRELLVLLIEGQHCQADVAAVTVPQQPRQLRPYAMLLSALSWGRLCSDPVHNEVRPDVGAAIYSSVSPKEGHRLTRSHQRPDVSGAGHRSYSSVLFLPSVRALILSGVASTLPLAALHSVSQAISSPKAPDN